MNTTGKLKVLPVQNISPSIIELDQKFFPYPWTTDAWKDLEDSRHLFMEWDLSGPQGFALFGWMAGEDTAHLYKIVIHPTLRGSGEIYQFWSAMLPLLKEKNVKFIYLEVEDSNKRALQFYKKVGFTCLRRVKEYYSNGHDGLMLQLTL